MDINWSMMVSSLSRVVYLSREMWQRSHSEADGNWPGGQHLKKFGQLGWEVYPASITVDHRITQGLG